MSGGRCVLIVLFLETLNTALGCINTFVSIIHLCNVNYIIKQTSYSFLKVCCRQKSRFTFHACGCDILQHHKFLCNDLYNITRHKTLYIS